MTLISSISGIRGTIGGISGDSLTPIDILGFAGAYGTWVKQKKEKPTIVIGRDARESGEMVLHLIVGTLNSLGIDVVDLGLASTPTVEVAVPLENAQGGIIITASHNPANWNALKLLNAKGEFISASEGRNIVEISHEFDFNFVETEDLGKYTIDSSYTEKHIDAILKLPLVDVDAIKEAKFKVGLDSVNSVGSLCIPILLKKLGVESIHEIFSEPHGRFSRVAEPLNENLTELCKLVKNNKLDLGIAVDPDVDRLALIAEDGRPFGEENTLVSIADYVLNLTPGPIVGNLSSTKALSDIAKKYDVQFSESAVGEVNVVQEMKESNAIIGGEGNGGVIYPESHYGRDALVGIALFLSHLAISKRKASELYHDLPEYFMLKDKIQLDDGIDLNKIFDAIRSNYKNHKLNEVDGLKIYFENGWAHMRKSNTEPIVRLYIENQTLEGAEQTKEDLLGFISNT